MQLAARALWPDAVPQRDDIVIFSRGSMYGVLDVFALITQGPDLPKADAISQPSPVLEAMPVSPESYAFTVVRRSTGEAIHLRVKPTLYPKEFFPLRKKAVEETATPEERRQLKQHRAKVFEKVFRRSEAELFETPVRYRMLMFGA